MKLKRIQTPVFPFHMKCKPYSPDDFQWSQAQNVVNCEFIPSHRNHPHNHNQSTARHSTFSSWTLQTFPNSSQHMLWGISGCSELPFLGSTQEQGGSFGGNWPPQWPHREQGQQVPPAWLSHTTHSHRMLRVPASWERIPTFPSQKQMSAWLGAISSRCNVTAKQSRLGQSAKSWQSVLRVESYSISF